MRGLLRNVSCFVRFEHLTNGHFIDWLVKYIQKFVNRTIESEQDTAKRSVW
jgi:hypothetical protein